MAGTIKLDGTTFLSKSGSDFTLNNVTDIGSVTAGTIGSSVTFPAGHVLQMKAVNIPTSQTISGGSTGWTGVSQTDITLNRNSGTHVLYCLQGGGAYSNSSGRSMYTIGRRTSGSTYTGTEVDLSTDADEGNSRVYGAGAALLVPFSISCFDSASISGDYTYRFFYRGAGGDVDFQKSDRGDITAYIMEFNPS